MRNTVLAFLIGVLAWVSTASAQDTTLRYRWVKGDEVRYRISQQSSMTISGLPGLGDLAVDLTIAQVMRMAVQDVAADGTATLRETFESVRMEQNSPLGKTVFDSASTEKPADPNSATLGSVMSAMVGESITMVIGPDGTVGKVEGMSAIVDKAVKALPPGPAAAMAGEQLKGIMSDDAIRSMVGQSFGSFPDRPLKTGDTWTNESEQLNPVFGKMSAARTYTLTGVESRNGATLAHLSVRLVMKQTGPPAPGLMGMTVKVDDSESTGEVVFDATKGRLQQASFTGETPVDLSITPPAGEAINIKGVSKNLVTTEIIDK